MSNKQHNRFNRTNGYHGKQCGHSNHQAKKENKVISFPVANGGFTPLEENCPNDEGRTDGSTDDCGQHRAWMPCAGKQKSVQDDMKEKAGVIGAVLADMITPVIRAAVLPNMQLQIGSIRFENDDDHPEICFSHPDKKRSGADDDGGGRKTIYY